MKNYYKILGIDKTASETEIKKTYKKLALKFHPDRNSEPGAEEKFKEISEAYSILSDPKKKSQYDMGGVYSNMHGNMDGFDPFGSYNTPFDLIDFLRKTGFDQYAEHSQQRNTNNIIEHGEKIELNLDLNLADALDVCKKEVSYLRKIHCKSCKGIGADTSIDAFTKCETCHGRGQIQMSQGPFVLSQTCYKCSGTGKVLSKVCNSCNGEQFSHKQEKLEIKIPAGIDHGHSVRIKHKGHEGIGKGSINGDLYIHINMKPHKLFMRKGENLYLEQKIPYTIAVLGGEIEIPILSQDENNKTTKITIPAGLSDEQIIEFDNLGLPIVNVPKNFRGKQIVKFSISIPKLSDLSDKQKKLLKNLHNTL